MVDKIALVGANIIDGLNDNVICNKAILINNEKIEDVIEFNGVAPEGYKYIDLHGKFIMPGLIDMHVHFYGESGGKFTNRYATYLPMFLASGITTVRSMGELNLQDIFSYKEKMSKAEGIGPEIMTAASYFDLAPSMMEWMDGSKDLAETKEKYYKLKNKIDLIKVYNRSTVEQIKWLSEQGKKDGLKVYGHLGMTTTKEAVLAGISGLEHGFYTMTEFYEAPDIMMNSKYLYETFDPDSNLATELINLIVENNVAITPTNTPFMTRFSEFYQKLDKYNMWNYIDEESREETKQRYYNSLLSGENKKIKEALIERQYRFVNRIYKKGGKIFAGTDTIFEFLVGNALVWEAMYLVKCGMTNIDVIKALTSNAAKELDKNNIGTIEKGKKANLLVLNSNPLADIENLADVNAIYKLGKYYNPDEIKRLFMGKVKIY